MDVKSFYIHRKDQWDLKGGRPIICIHKHYDQGSGCARIFCLWFDGFKIKCRLENPFKYRM
ncbi:hypothetical protein WKH56_33010 [Priestia sp. SB1]|uniref:hypothetical protein n=1 Tax=Priestia sp. SB1 TaxID=3132359 RepID=UPI00316E19A6